MFKFSNNYARNHALKFLIPMGLVDAALFAAAIGALVTGHVFIALAFTVPAVVLFAVIALLNAINLAE